MFLMFFFFFIYAFSSCFVFSFASMLFCIVFQRVLQIKTHSWEKTPVILIGNKCDMTNERVVQTNEGKKLADDLGKFFFLSLNIICCFCYLSSGLKKHIFIHVLNIFLGLEFFETSAKENINVKAVFER